VVAHHVGHNPHIPGGQTKDLGVEHQVHPVLMVAGRADVGPHIVKDGRYMQEKSLFPHLVLLLQLVKEAQGQTGHQHRMGASKWYFLPKEMALAITCSLNRSSISGSMKVSLFHQDSFSIAPHRNQDFFD
jgi:hypothetical protein